MYKTKWGLYSNIIHKPLGSLSALRNEQINISILIYKVVKRQMDQGPMCENEKRRVHFQVGSIWHQHLQILTWFHLHADFLLILLSVGTQTPWSHPQLESVHGRRCSLASEVHAGLVWILTTNSATIMLQCSLDISILTISLVASISLVMVPFSSSHHIINGSTFGLFVLLSMWNWSMIIFTKVGRVIPGLHLC